MEKKVSTTKTWATFKTNFKEVQDELKEIRGPTMQQVGFHHANMLADRLCNNLQQQSTEMLAMVRELAIADNNPSTNDVPLPPQPTSNAVLQDNVQVNIFRLLGEISTERRGGQGGRGSGSGDNNGCEYGRGYNERNRNRCIPDNSNFARCITDSY